MDAPLADSFEDSQFGAYWGQGNGVEAVDGENPRNNVLANAGLTKVDGMANWAMEIP